MRYSPSAMLQTMTGRNPCSAADSLPPPARARPLCWPVSYPGSLRSAHISGGSRDFLRELKKEPAGVRGGTGPTGSVCTRSESVSGRGRSSIPFVGTGLAGMILRSIIIGYARYPAALAAVKFRTSENGMARPLIVSVTPSSARLTALTVPDALRVAVTGWPFASRASSARV